MTTLTVTELVTPESLETIQKKILELAVMLELQVSTWRDGDPSKTILDLVARLFEQKELGEVAMIKSAWLDTSEKAWLWLKSYQDFGVEVNDGAYAEALGTLTNAKGGTFVFAPGDLIVSSSSSGATYRNVDEVTLGPSTAVGDVSVRADVIGADGNAAAGDIDTIVGTYAGVSFVSTTAAIGKDLESDPELRTRDRAKLSSLSPNGAKSAYGYIATSATLNGGANVTKVQEVGDSEDGSFTMWLANAAGPASGGDVTLVLEAISGTVLGWCITPSILPAVSLPNNVIYELWIYASANLTAQEVEDLVQVRIEELVAACPVGGYKLDEGDPGQFFADQIISAVDSAHPDIFHVTTANTDVLFSDGEVLVLGSITGTVNIVEGQ